MNEQLAEIDLSGLETLQRFKRAANFNKWLLQTIEPYCLGQILEVGSGIGNISELLLNQYLNVTLTDLRPEYCRILKERFDGHPHLKGISQLDLVTKDFENKQPEMLNRFDTIIAMNVIEHVSDDMLAIQNCRKMLKAGGHLIILVPADKKLYNRLDEELGHFKRYDKKEVAQLLNAISDEEVYLQYFNFAGIFGWWLNGVIFKKKIIPQFQLDIYDKLVAVFKWMDKIMHNKSGLSIIGIVKINS